MIRIKVIIEIITMKTIKKISDDELLIFSESSKNIIKYVYS